MKYFIIGLLLVCPLSARASALTKQLELFIQDYHDEAVYSLKKEPIRQEWQTEAIKVTGEGFLSRHILYSPLVVDGMPVAYVLVDKAMGKGAPFILAVIYDMDREIVKTRVLLDISPHGHKLNQDFFRTQFYGKGVNDSFVVGQELDGISGSSYSVKGFTRAVWRLCLIVEYLMK